MDKKDPTIRERIDSIVAQIEAATVRTAISDVFSELLELLEYLDLLEDCAHSEHTLPKAHLVLRFICEKASNLNTNLVVKVASAGGEGEQLFDLIDGTAFAISHEIKRISERPVPITALPSEAKRPELTRASGLLRNCFQQSIISLALQFDPSVTGAQLFEDFKLRLEQSTVLLQALELLKEQVALAESAGDLDSYFALIEGLKMFRQGYMQFLMYRDWEQFDTLSKEIVETRTEFDLQPRLHQLALYLETLIGHVGMRSVLNSQVHQLTGVNL